MRNSCKFLSTLILHLALSGCAGLSTPPLQSNAEMATQQIGPQQPKEATVVEQDKSNNESQFFDWPVDSAKFSRGFMPNKKPRPHFGIDLAAKRRTNILSAQTGNVVYAGRGFNGYGRFIIVEGKNNFASFYGHLDKILVKNGDRIEKGQLLGLMGDSGRAHGVHLHFEIRHNLKPIDPLDFLPGGKRLLSSHSSKIEDPQNLDELKLANFNPVRFNPIYLFNSL